MTFDVIQPFFAELGLWEYLIDPKLSELMITSGRVFIDRDGRLEPIPGIAINDKTVRAGVEIIARSLDDEIGRGKPWLDARLPDGSRVAALYPPASPLGVTLTIRKFRFFTVAELVNNGSITAKAENAITRAVTERKNVLFSGGTSSGKTTLANAFVEHSIPLNERLIVIEKPIEMKIGHANVARWEAVPAIGKDPGVTVSQLLTFALRHRPDRIIIGEVRDAVAFDMLQALNTGHSGTMTTIHADSTQKALHRVASLAMPGFGDLALSRQETAAALHFVVHVDRDRYGRRGISEVLAVKDYNDSRKAFVTEALYARN